MEITNKTDTANGFNNFSVNVGPILAKKTYQAQVMVHDILKCTSVRNQQSMFLDGLTESEILKLSIIV